MRNTLMVEFEMGPDIDGVAHVSKENIDGVVWVGRDLETDDSIVDIDFYIDDDEVDIKLHVNSSLNDLSIRGALVVAQAITAAVAIAADLEASF